MERNCAEEAPEAQLLLLQVEAIRTTCHLILNYHQRIKRGGCPHLSQGALSLYEFTEHKQGDEEQGDGGNEPAKDVGPQRINVRATELQRGVFDNGEDERALGWRETQRIYVKPTCAWHVHAQRGAEGGKWFFHTCLSGTGDSRHQALRSRQGP